MPPPLKLLTLVVAASAFSRIPNPTPNPEPHISEVGSAVVGTKETTLSPLKPAPNSLCSPDPDLLAWDTGPELPQIDVPQTYKGWLKVPILHDQPSLKELGIPLGYTAVRVAVMTKCAKGAKPILTHCGGPASGNECLIVDHFESTKHLLGNGMYDNLAITQRGIEKSDVSHDTDDDSPVPFKQDDGKTPVKRFPAIACYRFSSVYAIRAVKSAYEFAGLNWASIAAKLEKAMQSSYPATYMQMDKELVQLYAELVQAASIECRQHPDYQLGTNLVRGQMVYQDFMGTVDLAHDLDILRRAIGAEKLSIWGVSYGTEVGASYASIYPARVDKLILDGNVAISSEIYAAAELWALSYEETWNGLSAACTADFFTMVGPTGSVNIVSDADRLDQCAAAPYPSQKLTAKLDKDGDAKLDDLVEASVIFNMIMGMLEHMGAHGVDPIGSMLFACVQSYFQTGGFESEGCSWEVNTADPSFNLERHLSNSAIWNVTSRVHQDVALVRAVDMKGRLSPSGLSNLWSQLIDKHPFGFLRAANILLIGTAANLPRPVPPYGSALDTLAPLIIGQFGDPATTYTAAQVMQQNFKNGVLLSWQGYKHGLPMMSGLSDMASTNFHSAGYGAAECTDKMAKYLETGELPANGDVCPINGPAAGALGKGGQSNAGSADEHGKVLTTATLLATLLLFDESLLEASATAAAYRACAAFFAAFPAAVAADASPAFPANITY
eukprot:CAMPEP_0119343218 /NCGR_PEP_ID=MMETSP1333-20130426/106330_1 /TAXON_ID=418940 /ORGANISM="Scyphosphaera apsteinii, Strain RCC1455" /LENGTH=724 /DNA_ID=CAMNT_0007355599 /DNA_START=33 /DNA_END=2209 /DNA_ORIENTATION=-